MVLVSSKVKPGYRSVALYHHENSLRLMLEALGLASTNWPGAAKDASRIRAEPSELHFQISKLPECAEENTSCLPSGENCGPLSPQLEEINGVGGFNLPGTF